ncbi:MAG: DUF1566 domain-containing protein [Thermodesulfovibrionales bacterium]|nr:DUF1566 domain-containing protein [Thermodesulfovibrionales bacterium]
MQRQNRTSKKLRNNRKQDDFFSGIFGILFFLMLAVFPAAGYAGQTTLNWSPPTTNEDGTPITDLSGYKIYYGIATQNYTKTINAGNVTSYTVPSLTDGTTYYFAVTALNSLSKESTLSNEISRTMPLPVQQYALNVNKGGTGTGTITSSPAGINCGSDCSEAYTGGTVVTLTASTDGSSVFSGWSGGCTGTSSCVVTMNSVNTITATFTLKNYTITSFAGAGGSISPSGTVTVNQGAGQAFAITPNANYRISDVLVDGLSVGASATYSFSNVITNHTIKASFELLYPDITVTPASYYLGDVIVNADPVIMIFMVFNAGTGNLTVSTNMISDLKTAEFVLWDDNCSGKTVIPGDKCTVGIKFSPKSSGLKSASLVIPSNDPDTPTVYIPLEGNGVAALDAVSIHLPRTGQLLSYIPGDDGNVQAGVSWPEPRFTENGDGTVTDNLTGLMWLKDGACLGKKNWAGALNATGVFNAAPAQYNCKGYSAAYTDWRMPNIRELESLINYGVANSSAWLNISGFTNVISAYYWTGTTYPTSTQSQVVNLYSGAEAMIAKTKSNYLLPVRATSIGSPYEVPESGQAVSYAPGDDGEEKAGVAWPEPRVADNGDGTVTDNLTGLMWLKDGACLGKRNWAGALNAISGFNAASVTYHCNGYGAAYSDWRMPNIRELESLLHYGVADSSLWLNSFWFSNINSTYYWTSTGSRDLVWSVNMQNAVVASLRKTKTYNVVAVRDAQ